MSPLAAVIFLGIPALSLLFGVVAAISFLVGWKNAKAPEGHYIASRVQVEPADEKDKKWLAELNSLQLPYRHTVC